MKITVNGNEYELNDRGDLQEMRTEHWADWYSVRTANPILLSWALDNYLDELEKQDEDKNGHRGSTGSYGKRKEVMERVQRAIETGSRMYLHDVRARSQRLDDQRIGTTRIEHKTSFAQWAYGASANECWEKLNRMVESGIEMHWEPFKDEYEIVMPIGELLEYMSEYNDKGLSAWFHYVGIVTCKGQPRAVNQLQLQPVMNGKGEFTSYKKYRYIAELVKRQNPGYKITEQQKKKKGGD